MSEPYTPTTDEIIRSFTIPDHVTHPRRDGESLGQYLSRISIEGHASQVESEAAAHRWLAEHDRQVAERAWDEGFTRGFYSGQAMPNADASESPVNNPHEERRGQK